jgi:hypothetical protein
MGAKAVHFVSRDLFPTIKPKEFRMVMPANIATCDNYVFKYAGWGYGPPSHEEIAVRRTALDLKIPTDDAIRKAAPEMAALIDGPCWLVPVPASDGTTAANNALAKAIAELISGARVICAVGRTHPVESSYRRRTRGLPGLAIDEHAIIRTVGPLKPLPVYFIDNVVTTGTTIAACRRALGWGIGLTYADASTRKILASDRRR